MVEQVIYLHNAHVVHWKWVRYWEKDIPFMEPNWITANGANYTSSDSLEPNYGVD